jgi:hypothetical protein
MTQDTEEDWFAFGERLVELALSIFGDAELPITEKGATEPKVLAMALLARTVSNFKGASTLARQGLVVEARILARNCYENLLWIGGLAVRGDAFVKAMYDDECKSRIDRGQSVLAKKALNETLDQRLRAQLRLISRRPRRSSTLNAKSVARDGPLEEAYLVYSQLSADSAHPSFSALGRYIVRLEEDGEIVRAIDVAPWPKSGEIASTLNWACSALIGACVGVNELLGGTASGHRLSGVFEEYRALAGQTRSSEAAAPQ